MRKCKDRLMKRIFAQKAAHLQAFSSSAIGMDK
ncbi:hypothetical protein M2444_004268 [Paenibacillus sp. PastF-3]|nr:hypothetical protein [Paenibacillus sp. PastF-3]